MQLPKKPMGPYLLFKSHHVGNRWQNLSASEKEPFIKAYEDDKQTGIKRPKSAYFRFIESLDLPSKWAELDACKKHEFLQQYKSEAEAYKLLVAQYDQMYSSKALQAPPPPKKPVPAFFAFSLASRNRFDQYPQLENLNQQQQNKLLGEVWQAMSEAEKKPFVDSAEQERQNYPIALAAYEREWGALSYIREKRLAAEQLQKNAENGEEERKKRRREDVRAQREEAKRRRLEQSQRQQQHSATQKNMQNAKMLYRKSMLKAELDKFSRKALQAKTLDASANLNFDCAVSIAKIDEKWSLLTERTRMNWANRSKKEQEKRKNSLQTGGSETTKERKKQQTEGEGNTNDDDDRAENEEEEEDIEQSAEEDVQEDDDEVEEDDDEVEEEEDEEVEEEDDDEEEESDGARPVARKRHRGDDLEDERLLYGEDSDEDIEQYGDDGDDFVVPDDDEVEYEDGMTQEEIEQAKQMERDGYHHFSF